MIQTQGATYVGPARVARTGWDLVASDQGYPQGWQLKPLDVQAALLKKYFPYLDLSHVQEQAARYMRSNKLVLPDGMDGLALVPKPLCIASNVYLDVKDDDDWPIYNLAMRRLLEVMQESWRDRFYDVSRGRVGRHHLRREERTTKAYEANLLPGDVMALPVQMGILHRAQTPKYAWETLQADEFGLDAFAAGCILLTHPERLASREDLVIDCLGTILFPDDHMCGVPCWFFHDGKIKFHRHDLDNANPYYGAATAKLPR